MTDSHRCTVQVCQLVLGGTTVLPWKRGTSFHGTITVIPSRSRYYSGTAIPQIPRYYRTVLANHFSEDIRAKNQFIHRVNKLEVFKLHVDDIWCYW